MQLLQTELSDSKQKVDQLESELSDSKQKIDQLESELSESKQKVDQLESQMIKLQQNNRTLEVTVQVEYVVKVYYCYILSERFGCMMHLVTISMQLFGTPGSAQKCFKIIHRRLHSL